MHKAFLWLTFLPVTMLFFCKTVSNRRFVVIFTFVKPYICTTFAPA